MKARDLNGLFTFRTVVGEAGFSAAARQLGVTPSAISRAMAQLETSVGVRLFNRTTVEFSLTAEGQRLAALVCGKLSALDGALAKFKAEAEAPQGLLRVSLTNSYGKHYVLPRLGTFLDRYPDIRLEIAFNDNRRTLIEDGFDVGTCYGMPDEFAYISRVVCQPRLILVAAPSYLAARGVPRTPADIAAHTCINVSMGPKGPSVWSFQRRTGVSDEVPVLVQPQDRLLLSDQIDGVIPAAVAGLGLTVAHARAALPDLEAGRLKALLTDYHIEAKFGTRAVHVFFPHLAQIAPRVRAFVDFLIEAVGDEPTDFARFEA